MEITGTLKSKNDAVQVSEKFKKREFVLTENSTKYPQHIQFSLAQDKCAILDGYNVGDEIKVQFNLQGREWTNPQGEVKVFNTLDAWRIEKAGAASAPKAPQSNTNVSTPAESTFVASTGADDDLPF